MKKLFLLLIIFMACAESYTTGRIVRVIDGDTFVFQSCTRQFRVRMADIDAPELSQTYGHKSKDFLQRYLDKHAKLYCKGKDKYNRILATLFIDDENINELEIKLGIAWYYQKFSNKENYFYLQEAARSLKLGLWQYPAIPPWVYRKQIKQL